MHTAAVDPYDPEDLAVAADGTVWLADTGDNNANRPTVALLALRPDGSTRCTGSPTPTDRTTPRPCCWRRTARLPRHQGGARGQRGLPSGGALVDGGTVAIGKVAAGQHDAHRHAGGPVGRAGQLLITGGAVAGDGSARRPAHLHRCLRLAARRFRRAPRALAAAPVRIPLPDSPQGEAISFAADSRQPRRRQRGLTERRSPSSRSRLLAARGPAAPAAAGARA